MPSADEASEVKHGPKEPLVSTAVHSLPEQGLQRPTDISRTYPGNNKRPESSSLAANPAKAQFYGIARTSVPAQSKHDYLLRGNFYSIFSGSAISIITKPGPNSGRVSELIVGGNDHVRGQRNLIRAASEEGLHKFRERPTRRGRDWCHMPGPSIRKGCCYQSWAESQRSYVLCIIPLPLQPVVASRV